MTTEEKIDANLNSIVTHVLQISGGTFPDHCVNCAVKFFERCLAAANPEVDDAPPEARDLIRAKLAPLVIAHMTAADSLWSA